MWRELSKLLRKNWACFSIKSRKENAAFPSVHKLRKKINQCLHWPLDQSGWGVWGQIHGLCEAAALCHIYLKPVLDVDMSEISEQISEVFTLSTVHLEREILNLQTDIMLNSHTRLSGSLWMWRGPPTSAQESLIVPQCLVLYIFVQSAFYDLNLTSRSSKLVSPTLKDCIRVNLLGQIFY